MNPGVKPLKESAFQQRLDLLVEFLERGHPVNHLAIDEKGRCPPNFETSMANLRSAVKARRAMIKGELSDRTKQAAAERSFSSSAAT
jgi:hypothetical protein